MSAADELIALARSLTPSGQIGDGMVAQFHELADRAQREQYALGLLVEEAGEIAQLVGKALRFGLESPGPDREPYLGRTARQLLPIEAGDMGAAITWAISAGVINGAVAEESSREKLKKLLDPAARDSNRGPLAPTLFEPNPDHATPDGMRRSIHRSHRGEGFNDGVGE